MRSYLLTAAIAASLVTTSITLGYAASSGNHSGSRSEGEVHSQIGPGERESSGRSDSVPDMTPLPPMFRNSMHSLRQPTAFYVTHRNPRLSLVMSELGRTQRLIAVERHRGSLTPIEAKLVRDESRAIGRTALNIARVNDGAIPDSNYDMLRDRVAGLHQTIQLYASHVTHA